MKVRVLAIPGSILGLLLFGCQTRDPEPHARNVPPAAASSAPREEAAAFAPPVVPQLSSAELAARRFNLQSGYDIQSPGGVVTSVEKQATEIGVALLEAGGNAVDAAVGVAFALAVTHPSAGNIGGGGFSLVRINGQSHAYDFRENSPLGLDQAKYRALLAARGSGRLAVGVPGTVSGLLLMHERHGKLSRKDVLTPALRLAEDGFLVGRRQSKTFAWSELALKKDAPSRKLFFPNGLVPAFGTRLKNPGLAKVFKKLIEQGADGFYRGEVANDLVQSTGGALSLDDLSRYEAKERTPLESKFRGYRVLTMPPSSGGGVVLLEALQLLDSGDFVSHDPGTTLYTHFIAEALRRGHVDRRLHVRAPDEAGNAPLEKLLRKDRWKEFPISAEKKTPSAALDNHFPQADSELEHTTHFGVVDKDGNVVSCTVTLSSSFGAKLTTRATGIVLNNSVGSFSSVGENLPRAGVRTISSMTPTLVLGEGSDVLVLGSPGGDTIPGTVLEVLLLLLEKRTLREAVDAPRFHQGFVPDVLAVEAALPETTFKELRKLGHVMQRRGPIGDANIAAYSDSGAVAVADEREGGVALGARVINQ